ncbi:hypothetical protein FRB95_006971 [Tulasnella sp. JGI-2019a]|nr:hypothetical protein FRB95_006971 [Tulasnella sp. JGI-2019a]
MSGVVAFQEELERSLVKTQSVIQRLKQNALRPSPKIPRRAPALRPAPTSVQITLKLLVNFEDAGSNNFQSFTGSIKLDYGTSCLQQLFEKVDGLRQLEASAKNSFFYEKRERVHQITGRGIRYDRVPPQATVETTPLRQDLYLIVRSKEYWLLSKGPQYNPAEEQEEEDDPVISSTPLMQLEPPPLHFRYFRRPSEGMPAPHHSKNTPYVPYDHDWVIVMP